MGVRRCIVEIISAILAINVAIHILYTLGADVVPYLPSNAAAPGRTQEIVQYVVSSCAVLWLKYFNVLATVVGFMLMLYLKVIKSSVNSFLIMCKCPNCQNGEPWRCEIEDYGPIQMRTNSITQLGVVQKRDLISFLKDFVKLVNLDALKAHLYQNGVLTTEDGIEMKSSMALTTDTPKVEQFLLIMSKKGSGSIDKLIQALEASAANGNGGHEDLAELLKEEYCSSRSCCSGGKESTGKSDGGNDMDDVESKDDESPPAILIPTRMPSSAAMALQWPGLDVRAYEDLDLTSGEAKLYNREQKGLKIYIPENAVKDHALMHVSVFTRGQLQLPDRCELISAVYAICIYGKLAKPVTLEIEHCAAIRHQSDTSYLRFVHAQFSETLPYRFEYLKKARSEVESYIGEQSKYGTVTIPAKGSIKEFCALLAIVHVRKRRILSPISNDLQCKYRVQVYFEALAPDTEWLDEWRAHVVVFKDHEPWRQIFQEKYPASKFVRYDEDLVVTFEKETTVLLRAQKEDNTHTSGAEWKISATSNTTLSKKEVDNYQGLLDTGQLSTCIFHLKWSQPVEEESSTQDHHDYPPEVYLRLEMKGTRKPYDTSSKVSYLLICFSPKRNAIGLRQLLRSCV